MDLRLILIRHIGLRDIEAVCAECRRSGDVALTKMLCGLTDDSDDRVAYNAMWILTHLWKDGDNWLHAMHDILIGQVLHTSHTGRRRMALTLLLHIPFDKNTLRTDYLDYCLAGISSAEPYGVRALCMKQMLEFCRIFPELTPELLCALDMMDSGDISPGLAAARRNVLAAITREPRLNVYNARSHR